MVMSEKPIEINSFNLKDAPIIEFLNRSRSSSQISLPPISSFDSIIEATHNHNNNFLYPPLSSNKKYNYASIPPLSCLLNTPKQNPVPFTLPIDQELPTRVGKTKKKQECPICHKLFANLNTHSSTHLTPENRPHKCSKCYRGFSRSNDLIRHKKRHWKDRLVSVTKGSDQFPIEGESFIKRQNELKQEQLKSLYQTEGAYKCPYNSILINLDRTMNPHKLNIVPPKDIYDCHPTGVFSRCDTFKNHLKALHFEYPPKTKKEDRAIVPGRCKHCSQEFPNVDIWINNHVEKGCGYTYY